MFLLKRNNYIFRNNYFLSFFQKSYPEISSLRNLICVAAIPFENEHIDEEIQKIFNPSVKYVNILNQKTDNSQWSSVQLQVFIARLNDRDNYEGMTIFF